MSDGAEMKVDVGFVWAKENGIATIRIEYSGAGDSGQTDAVKALDRQRKPVVLPEGFVKALEDWAWGPRLIPQDGWWNNDGGYGTVVIRFFARKPATVTIKHYDSHTVTKSTLRGEDSGTRPLYDAEEDTR